MEEKETISSRFKIQARTLRKRPALRIRLKFLAQRSFPVIFPRVRQINRGTNAQSGLFPRITVSKQGGKEREKKMYMNK